MKMTFYGFEMTNARLTNARSSRFCNKLTCDTKTRDSQEAFVLLQEAFVLKLLSHEAKDFS